MPFLLHQLLTESAQRFPDREAARFEGRSMTYAQLDQLSNQLAGVLQESGVKKGDRVGIYVHKSFASLVSVFSVMKAGGTYVPLDPNAPAMRLAYITRNCEIKVLLTATNKLHQVSEIINEGSPLNVVVLTDDDKNESPASIGNVELMTWSNVLGRSNEIDPVEPIETDLAYILYTSGSTGEPKGVMISHRTIFTFINWCFKTFSLTPDDRVTSHAPLHFDLSTFDIFVTIKAGATIVLLPEKASIFPVKLVKLLREERVTITYLVPSILALMVNYGKLTDHDLS